MPDALVIDKRNALGGKPALHAILIGVSAYEFLRSADEPDGEGLLALKKLESSALSAIRMMDKLVELDAAGRLFRPLGTVRLLTAPSDIEQEKEPRLKVDGGRASLDHVETALNDWRNDVAVQSDNQSLFFFSGHGLRRTPEESIVLTSDFKDPRRPDLRYAFNTANVRDGMVPGQKFPHIGREQFYFVDACRDKPDALDQLDSTQTTKVFDAELGGLDDRAAPTYFATIPGAQAYGEPGEPTFFTKALLWALEHGAVDKRRLDGVVGAVWPVNADSLRLGIIAADEMFAGRVELKGRVGNPTLCFRRDPPELSLKLALAPDTLSAQVRKVVVTELNSGTKVSIASSGQPGPFSQKIHAGMYQAKAQPKSKNFGRPSSEIMAISIQTQMPWVFDLGPLS